MNLVSFSIKTKGMYNFSRRLWTVFTRFGLSESRTRRGLYAVIHALQARNAAPTFFIPAVVLRRHAALIGEVARCGTEIGIHGYVHNDYRTLDKFEQFKQIQLAISIFQNLSIPNQGFRNPYLGWTEESLDVYASLGFKYESNIAILHDVVDLNAFSALLQNGFAKSLKLFQAISCSIYSLRPQFKGDLLRIPTSIPDDEMLFDRLRITDPQDVGQFWSEVMQRVYDYGGLYTLNLHPERGVLCRPALEALLEYACSRPLPVWIARIGDIAQWWSERSRFRLSITFLGSDHWQVETICTQRATLLARHLTVENSSITSWYGSSVHVQSHSFTVKSTICPCIGVSSHTPPHVLEFFNQQGYPVIRCSQEETYTYALYLDKPEGLGETPEEQEVTKRALVEQIEALESPFLYFGCWPDGNRAALAVSGDIDSVTVQDFFLRIVEVCSNR